MAQDSRCLCRFGSRAWRTLSSAFSPFLVSRTCFFALSVFGRLSSSDFFLSAVRQISPVVGLEVRLVPALPFRRNFGADSSFFNSARRIRDNPTSGSALIFCRASNGDCTLLHYVYSYIGIAIRLRGNLRGLAAHQASGYRRGRSRLRKSSLDRRRRPILT